MGDLYAQWMLDYAHGDKSAQRVLPTSSELGEWQTAVNATAYTVSVADPAFMNAYFATLDDGAAGLVRSMVTNGSLRAQAFDQRALSLALEAYRAAGLSDPDATATAESAVRRAKELLLDQRTAAAAMARAGDAFVQARGLPGVAASHRSMARSKTSSERDIRRVPWDVHSADEADDEEERTAYRNAYAAYIAANEGQASTRAALEAADDDVKAMCEFLSQPATDPAASSTYRRTMAELARE